MSLETLYQQVKEGVVKELHIILKCDVQGSLEVVTDLLEKLSSEKVKLKIVHSGTGAPKIGIVAGCYVLEGVVVRNSEMRLLRDNVVIHEGKIDSLKRFKDDVTEVKTGLECGIGISNFNDIKIGDIIECFKVEKKKPEEL
jgi:translation initiation factor IF-2